MADEKIPIHWQLLVMMVAPDRLRTPSELSTHVSKFGFRPIDFEGGQDRL